MQRKGLRLKVCMTISSGIELTLVDTRNQVNKTYTSQVAESHIDLPLMPDRKRLEKMQWTREG